MDCWSLKRITIPEGVTVIEEVTFWRCRELRSVMLPKTITSIGADAFGRCFELTNITLPEGLKTIKNNAFRECYKLQKITVPSTVKEIGYDAFYRDSDDEYIVDYKCGYIRETDLPQLIDDNDSNGVRAPLPPDGNAKIRAELEAEATKEAEAAAKQEIIEPEKADFDGDSTVTVKDAFSMITSTASGTVSVEEIMPLLKLLVS